MSPPRSPRRPDDLQAVGVASEREASCRREQPHCPSYALARRAGGRRVVLPSGLALACQHDHPRWPCAGHRLGATRAVRRAADGLLAGELERQQAGDTRERDPPKLRRRLGTQDDERSFRARGGRQRYAERDGPLSAAARLVSGGIACRGRRLHGRVDHDRLAAADLERQRPAEEAGDRGDERGHAAALQRATPQLRLQQGGLPLQLRAALHDVADHTPLQDLRIRPGQEECRDAGPGENRRGGIERGHVALDEEHARYRHGCERGDEVAQLAFTGRDHRQHRRRRDDQVARFERVERRHAGAQHADPGDGAGRLHGTRAGWTLADPDRRRQQLRGERGEVGHRGGGPGASHAPRAATSESTRLPNSWSKSTWRSARPTRSRRPSGPNLAHTRRRGR